MLQMRGFVQAAWEAEPPKHLHALAIVIIIRFGMLARKKNIQGGLNTHLFSFLPNLLGIDLYRGFLHIIP